MRRVLIRAALAAAVFAAGYVVGHRGDASLVASAAAAPAADRVFELRTYTSPERQVAAASEVDGRIVSNVESVYLNPTDYSPIK